MKEIRDSYDKNAELYAKLFLHELDRDLQSQRWLTKFVELASAQQSQVADLGCGPGSLVNHLARQGLAVVGYDISTGQIEQAKLAYPNQTFRVGDLRSLGCADESLGGIVARHSIIHLSPSSLPALFAEWIRALATNAPLFLSFFGSLSVEAHGKAFDHKVTTAYELSPEKVAQHLSDVGFVNVEIETNPIPAGGRPFDHATILAQKPG